MDESTIKFEKIVNDGIFGGDFNPFTKYNTIEFKNNMAVAYGANGTGKTSLLKVLSKSPGTSYKCNCNGTVYSSDSDDSLFYTIKDQNARNIIEGEAEDYLIGSEIKKEQELRNEIEDIYTKFKEECIKILKKFGIKKINPLLKYTGNLYTELFNDLANSKSKGRNYQIEDFIRIFDEFKGVVSNEHPNKKIEFIIEDIAKEDSLLLYLLQKSFACDCVPEAEKIEPTGEAVKILQRFNKEDKCIVCDTNINPISLLERKKKEQEILLSHLPNELKNFLLGLFEKVALMDDPFNIKETVINAIKSDDKGPLDTVRQLIRCSLQDYQLIIINEFKQAFQSSGLIDKWREYQKILANKPEISDEDIMYIREIIANNMNRPLRIDREEGTRNWRITLNNSELLMLSREKLALSAGEQNFISLAFEFLKARSSRCQFIVIDDPISSFDSIYKNKVVYALMSILEHKDVFVLTHNLDFVRLLKAQRRDFGNLYLFNNVENGVNGFIPINCKEQDLLTSLEKLLTFFREEVLSYLTEENLIFFLMAMIPFMRGYANIIGKKSIANALTLVMHGYLEQKVDLIQCYLKLFNIGDDANLFTIHTRQCPGLFWGDLTILQRNSDYQVSAADILSLKDNNVLNDSNFKIINNDNYFLLNRTLRHSLVYLYLRLLVEKTLVHTYDIPFDSKPLQLGDIINKAFPRNSTLATNKKRFRVNLVSKRTLLNDFNHFEGNLSIFQPAIDITDQALGDEKGKIEDVLRQIEESNSNGQDENGNG